MHSDKHWHQLVSLTAVRMGLISEEACQESLLSRLSEEADLPVGFAEAFLKSNARSPDKAVCDVLQRARELVDAHDGNLETALAAIQLVDSDATLAVPTAPIDEALVRVSSGHAATHISQDQNETQDRFRILHPLASGKGGMGVISVARDQELDRDVAIKQISSRLGKGRQLRERFEMEARITGSLEHPGVIPVYGFGVGEDQQPYYAMRLVRGKTLSAQISNLHNENKLDARGLGSLEFRNLIDRLIDIAQVLAYAHSRGILHRDLKPNNVLLGEYGETLVIDWGLADHFESQAQHPIATPTDEPASPSSRGTPAGECSPAHGHASRDTALSQSAWQATVHEAGFVGTPGYVSPEQAAGLFHALDGRSDIFSFGAILYLVLTGEKPFGEHSSRELVLSATLAGKFPPPRKLKPAISKSLEAVCLKCLATNPSDRYATAEQLVQDLELWKADLPVSALPENFIQQTWRWLRRNLAIAVAAAVLCIASVSGLAWANWMQNQLTIESAQRQVAQQKVEVEQARLATAELQRQQAESRSAADNYFRMRTEFENILIEKKPGWLADASSKLELVPPAPGDTDDAFWRRSAELKLRTSQELRQVGKADVNELFSPYRLGFSETGKYLIAGQHKASNFTSLKMLLYDTDTKKVVETFPFSTSKSAVTNLTDLLMEGKGLQQELTQSVLISEELDLVAAATSRQNVVIWRLSDPDAAPRVVSIDTDFPLDHLLLDRSQRQLHVVFGTQFVTLKLDGTSDLPVASGSTDRFVRNAVWDEPTRRLLLGSDYGIRIIDMNQQAAPVEKVTEQFLHRIAFAKQARILVAAFGKQLRIHDADSLEVTGELKLANETTPDFEVTDLSLSDDGTYLAYCGRRGSRCWMELWNLATSERIGREELSERVMIGFQFLPASHDLVRLEIAGMSWWKVGGVEGQQFEAVGTSPILDADWNTDGSRLLLSRMDRLEMWQAANNDLTLSSTVDVSGDTEIRIAPDGSHGFAHRHSYALGHLVVPFANDEFGSAKLSQQSTAGFWRTLTFDPWNGEQYVTIEPTPSGTAGRQEVMRLRSTNDDRVIAEWDDGGRAEFFTGRGYTGVVDFGRQAIYGGLRNGRVRKLARDLSKLEHERTAFESESVVSSLKVSPTGTIIAAGSLTGEVVLLDADNLKVVGELEGHDGSTSALCWSADGKNLLTAGTDGVLRGYRITSDRGLLEQVASPIMKPQYRLQMPAPVVRLTNAGDQVWMLLEGERAVRRYPIEFFIKSEQE